MGYIFNTTIILTLLLAFDMLGFYLTNKHKLSVYFSLPIGFLVFLGMYEVIVLPAQILHWPLFATIVLVTIICSIFLVLKRKTVLENLKTYIAHFKTKQQIITNVLLLMISILVAWHSSPQGDSKLYYPMIADSVNANMVNAITMSQHFLDGYLTLISMLNQIFIGDLYLNIVFFSKIFENFIVFTTMYAIVSFFFNNNRNWLFAIYLIGLSFGIILLTPFYYDIYEFSTYGMVFACPNGTIILTTVLLPTFFYLSYTKLVKLEILIPMTIAGFAASSSFLFILPILFLIWGSYLWYNKMQDKIMALFYLALPAIFFVCIFVLIENKTNYGILDQINKIMIASAVTCIAYLVIDLLKWKKIYLGLFYATVAVYITLGVYLFFQNYEKAIQQYSDVIAGSWIFPTYIDSLVALFLVGWGLYIIYHKNKDLFTYLTISFILIGNIVFFIGYGTQMIGLNVFTRVTILMPVYLAVYYSLNSILIFLKKFQYKILIPIAFYIYLFFSPYVHVFTYINLEVTSEDWITTNPYDSLEDYEEEIQFLYNFDYPESKTVQLHSSFQLGGVAKANRPDLDYVKYCKSDCYLFIHNKKELDVLNPQTVWKNGNFTMYYIPDNDYWINYKDFDVYFKMEDINE